MKDSHLLVQEGVALLSPVTGFWMDILVLGPKGEVRLLTDYLGPQP